MSYVIPHNHKRDLRAALGSQGWDVAEVEADSSAWWMNELWLIKSTWRPVGVEAFVAFVGGPDGNGNPEEGANHVAIGAAPPEHWFGEGIARVGLTPDWPAKLKSIVELAAQLRSHALRE